MVPFGPKGLVQRKGIAVTPNSWSKLRCLLCTKISRIGRSAHGRERNAQAQRATASSFDSLKTSDGCTKTNQWQCSNMRISHARWSALRGAARDGDRSLILSFDRTVTAIKRLTNVRSMKCSKENETPNITTAQSARARPPDLAPPSLPSVAGPAGAGDLRLLARSSEARNAET
jgi:hypothetical protein